MKKEPFSVWDNFDEIYCIHLPHRIDRFEHCKNEFYKVGLDGKVIFWNAISQKDGRMGLIKTLIELFRMFLKGKGETVLVLEDDVTFINNPIENLQRAVEQLKKHAWDALYFGANTTTEKAWCKREEENLFQICFCYTAHAVVYKRHIIEKLLLRLQAITEIKDITDINDVILAYEFQPIYRFMMVNPIIATQMPGYSDLEKTYVNYLDLIKTPKI